MQENRRVLLAIDIDYKDQLSYQKIIPVLDSSHRQKVYNEIYYKKHINKNEQTIDFAQFLRKIDPGGLKKLLLYILWQKIKKKLRMYVVFLKKKI